MHDGEDFITIRSSAAADGPPASHRVSPADAHLLPKLRTENAEPALRTAPGAHHWRVELVEIQGGPVPEGDLVQLGDGSGRQNSLGAVPHDLVLDRCYIHGDPGTGRKRGIALNSAATTVTGCWIDEIKLEGQDSQAIAGWNGPGPFTIVNNRLEAAGEVFLLGGSDPAIGGLVPSGIRFRANYLTRPVGWRDERWQVKNLLELKNARDVLIEGNVFENNWQAAQSGYAILFTPRNQDGHAPWSRVENVRFRNNVVRHVAAAVSILGHDSPNESGPARDIEITGNLFYDVEAHSWGGNGDFLLIGDGPSDVRIDHNTILQSGNLVSAYGGPANHPVPIAGFVFAYNIARHNEYGVHGSDHGVGNDTLSAYFPGAVFTGNVIAGGSASAYPSGNEFPSSGSFDRLFVDPSAGDFRLTAKARVPRLGDGQAAGVAMGALLRAWKAAEDGVAPALAVPRQR